MNRTEPADSGRFRDPDRPGHPLLAGLSAALGLLTLSTAEHATADTLLGPPVVWLGTVRADAPGKDQAHPTP
ncbi:hypothetical protein ACSMX9_27240 [Streptomyces sp. LE64]|uniref:hypothetical protein n=1 Tax=Streptomyces sp. LE64 TaxID=3448653 RepID=UPI004042D709